MHADSIRLLGKSAGVGVNAQGNVKALTGDLTVTVDCKVQIASTGVLDAKQALSIAGDLSSQGVLRNGGPLSLVGNIDIQGPIHFGGTAGSVNNLKPGTIVTGGAASTGAQNGIGVVINRPVASRPSYVVAPPVWSKPVVSYPAFNWSAYPSFAFNTATGLKQPTRILPQPRYW